MRLVFLLLADAAEFTDLGTMNIQGAGLHAVLVPSFPTRLDRLVAVCQVEGQITELGSHVLSLVVVGPDGELVGERFEQRFVLRRHELIPYRPVGYPEIIDCGGVGFTRPGDYAVHVLVDGSDLGSEPLYVRGRPS